MRQGLATRVQGFGFDPIYIAMNMFVGRLFVSFAICLAIGVAADSAESRRRGKPSGSGRSKRRRRKDS